MADQNRSNFTTFDHEKVEHVEEEPDQQGQSELKAHLPLHAETRLTCALVSISYCSNMIAETPSVCA
jgi:hypothetical protein